MYYYEVAPTKIIRQDADVFTYQHSDELADGTVVTIPVGKKSFVGVVVKKTAKPSFTTRDIATIVDTVPVPKPLIDTARWMSVYYSTHLSVALSTILPRGVQKSRRARTHTEAANPIRTAHHWTPSKDQQMAIDTIQQSTHTTHLLHGVTGSGKTLVYKQLAAHTLAQGKSVIVLVPEIALTSQLVDEFKQDFPGQVLVTHSKQTEAERHTTWLEALHSASPQVVIGPRSALFLPFANLGLIVIDEMHEPSYKQDQSPRYSALRTATILAKHHRAKTVFGSATPPVAEYYAMKRAGAPIIELPTPVQSVTPPTIEIVDMTKKNNFSVHRFLSNTLLSAMNAALDNDEQVLLFHNRRGSAAITLCQTCGWSAVDPSTGTPLTLHVDTHQLISHLTGYTTTVPTMCPVCQSSDIIHKGIGTKLIESEVKRLYPNKKVVRFDGDAARENSVDVRYQELYNGEIDIIIGTQVIAKGIDLPKLTTVGIIQADAGLAMPDFTSPERVFQLTAQATGRIGRHAGASTAIIQSYQPSHAAIQNGARGDYMAFYHSEIPKRQQYHFPPFTYLLKFICSYKTEAATIKNAKQFSQTLKQNLPPHTNLLGPTPAFYERSGDTYRWQITVMSSRRAHLTSLVAHMPTNGHWQYEIDPSSLLS